jgi:hypothetical protein
MTVGFNVADPEPCLDHREGISNHRALVPKSPSGASERPCPRQSSARMRRRAAHFSVIEPKTLRLPHQPGMNRSAGSPAPLSSKLIVVPRELTSVMSFSAVLCGAIQDAA